MNRVGRVGYCRLDGGSDGTGRREDIRNRNAINTGGSKNSTPFVYRTSSCLAEMVAKAQRLYVSKEQVILSF
jgi:hypothetical protein